MCLPTLSLLSPSQIPRPLSLSLSSPYLFFSAFSPSLLFFFISIVIFLFSPLCLSSHPSLLERPYAVVCTDLSCPSVRRQTRLELVVHSCCPPVLAELGPDFRSEDVERKYPDPSRFRLPISEVVCLKLKYKIKYSTLVCVTVVYVNYVTSGYFIVSLQLRHCNLHLTVGYLARLGFSEFGAQITWYLYSYEKLQLHHITTYLL